ncbi:MAG: peptide chain release factor N(5)-glutamine methyltransferase [Actinobacteria bacterium]|nr:peptide chain release factor N(5)-glutamine methyltransferase [Actinomycetota bacterium]
MARIETLLLKAGITPARREALWVIEAVTGMSTADVFVPGEVLDEAQDHKVLELALRRADGEPLQYVTGVAGFRHLELAVGPGVFIPRPETELLVDRALARLPAGGRVADVGTGSGAIALAIAQERPDAVVWATESSTEALAWAKKNRDALSSEVELIECNLLDGLPAELKRALDVAVSNPPYIAWSDRPSLDREVATHEPSRGLYSGDDGMEVTARLARDALMWLRPGGWLVLEIGESHGPRAARLLERLGYEEVSVGHDLNERDRIAEGRAA